MTTGIRWKQRFENYQKALLLLEQLANQKTKNRAETEGMIQRFVRRTPSENIHLNWPGNL